MLSIHCSAPVRTVGGQVAHGSVGLGEDERRGSRSFGGLVSRPPAPPSPSASSPEIDGEAWGYRTKCWMRNTTSNAMERKLRPSLAGLPVMLCQSWLM